MHDEAGKQDALPVRVPCAVREAGGEGVKRPLCVELFCGMFGWSQGWHEMGGRTVGFDIDHQPYHGPVPPGDDLILQDVLTLDGRQFKDASLILASPPCQEFSYMAMPWTRAKQIALALRGQGEFPDKYTGSRTVEQLTALFDACFRIQREASEAAGRHIPMVVENVRGAQAWVGRARWSHGSYALWGDVPALMPIALRGREAGDGPKYHHGRRSRGATPGCWNPDGRKGVGGGWFESAKDHPMRQGTSKGAARKAAAALVARIPLQLARHIARVYFPPEL